MNNVELMLQLKLISKSMDKLTDNLHATQGMLHECACENDYVCKDCYEVSIAEVDNG